MTKTRLIANFILFQVGWFSCVLFGATSLHLAGTLAAGVIVLIHLRLAANPVPELILVLYAISIGLLWDSALVSLGVLQYQHGMISAFMAPHWIIAMWALFATTINISLSWMKANWLLAVLMGAIGGPLSYYAGYKLGAVQIPDMTLGMIALAIGWAIFMPVLVWLARRYDGVTEPSAGQAGLAAA